MYARPLPTGVDKKLPIIPRVMPIPIAVPAYCPLIPSVSTNMLRITGRMPPLRSPFTAINPHRENPSANGSKAREALIMTQMGTRNFFLDPILSDKAPIGTAESADAPVRIAIMPSAFKGDRPVSRK